jgi:hypothetical protein
MSILNDGGSRCRGHSFYGCETEAFLKHTSYRSTPSLLRAFPNNPGKTIERNERLAGVGPFAQFVDSDMITRLSASPMIEQRTRNIDHMRRARAPVEERSATASAEAACGACRFVFVARNFTRALGDAEALAPAPYVGRVGRAVREPTCACVIVPGPARWKVDFNMNQATKALAGHAIRPFGLFFVHQTCHPNRFPTKLSGGAFARNSSPAFFVVK